MMKIALIGVGVMGEPMARNLKKAGFAVTVYNRTPSRCDVLRPLGIEIADSARQAISSSEVVIVMVPTHAEVDQVLGRTANGAVGLPVQARRSS